MAPDLKPATFRIDQHLLDKLEEIRQRDGVPISEQVRRAITAWLEQRGEQVKTERKRAPTRKRS